MMQSEMQSEMTGEIAKALAAAQAEIEDPLKTRTGKVSGTTKAGKYYEYEYKYADLADVLKNARKALSKHGIAVSQPTVVHDNVLLVKTKLLHSSGEWLSSDYPVCSISGEHQKMGAALTYAKRYALTSLTGIAADDDTDGQNAEAVAVPNGRKSSASLKREQVWPKLEHELSECESIVAVDRLQRDYEANEFLTWNSTFREQAQELFERARSDLSKAVLREQLEGSLAAENAPEAVPVKMEVEWGPHQSRAAYVQWVMDEIDAFTSVDDMRPWWNKQAPARRRFRLIQEEVEILKRRFLDKRHALLSGRGQPQTDKAGNPLHPLDAG